MTTITLEKAKNKLKSRIALLENTSEIINKLLNIEDREYVDDHNRGDRVQSLRGWALVEYNDQVCPFPLKGNGACLNPLYLSEEDGKVHLSTWSIGPYFANIEAINAAGLNYYLL